MAAQKQQLPRHAKTRISGPVVFISYARADGIEFAKELASWLESNGYVPWLDVRGGIRGGDVIDVSIEQAIAECLAVVVVLTEGSAKNDTFVRKELQYATDCGATIIPVKLSEHVRPPITIATTHWLTAEEALGPVLIEVLGGVPKQRVILHPSMGRNDLSELRRLDITHLPLPLAQLWKRARNAKTAHERHLASYYLWEAALKLLAFVAIIEYARRPEKDQELAIRLKNLARPNIGQWWEFVRRLLPILAERGDEPLSNLRDLILGPVRDDLPLAAGMDAAIAAVLEPDADHGARVTVRLSDLFHRMIMYRNREIGHLGLRPADYYDRMASVMLNGLTDLLGRLDVLAGRRLIYISEVSLSESGSHVIHRFELAGEEPHRLKTWEVNERLVGQLPKPGRIYLESPRTNQDIPEQGLPDLVPVHPFAIYDANNREVLFLDGSHASDRAGYKGYITGNDRLEILPEEHSTLLQRVLGMDVSESELRVWADKSRAETPLPEAVRLKGQEPKKLGEFELLSRIGRGGMGVVYRAFQPSLGRQVALKRLSKPDDEKAVSCFSREIRALGRIEHPNIVRIFTSGSDGEEYFYAMELIEGADLTDVCTELRDSAVASIDKTQWQAAVSSACHATRTRERPLGDGNPLSLPPDPEDSRAANDTLHMPPSMRSRESYIRIVVEIVRQVAAAANQLHENGIVHRDIKPGNIILTKDGFPVLMDLGLAQLADSVEGRLTRTRQFVGTLRYASPEQVLAVDQLDRRSDVYSLGAVLWELLTLQPLFGATDETPDHELMKCIEFRAPESVRQYNPLVERDLASIIEKCLEKDPAARYPTASALADDLDRWLRGERVQAFPRTPLYSIVKSIRRYRRQLVATALAVVFVVAAASFYWAVYIHPSSTTYATWIFRHRLVEGYGQLSADQVRHRNISTRFIRRGWWGPVIRAEAINGHGQPKRRIGTLIGEWSDPDIFVSSVDFRHDSNGHIAREIGKDPNGNVIWELAYHGGNSTSASFLDQRGLMRRLTNSGATHVHFERDSNGYDIKVSYTDISGNPRPNADGSYGRSRKYNEQGLPIETTYLGVNGKPAYSKDHVVKVKQQYNKMGNATEISYYDSMDKSVVDQFGIWKAVYRFDKYGNSIRREFYDTHGAMTLSTEYIAGWTSEYDDWGNEVRRRFFGLKEEPCRSDEEHAGKDFKYDDRGRNIVLQYVDVDGSIMELPTGYAEERFEYNKNDHLIATEFYDDKGKRTLDTSGVWRTEMIKDLFGNEIERWFFDINGNPTLSNEGIGGWRSEYDNRGNETSRKYMTTDGNLTTYTDGYSGWRSWFDDYGNESRTEYFDADNKPTLVEGIAGWQSDFDQYGNETAREYFGIGGKPPRHQDGESGWRAQYEGSLMATRTYYGYEDGDGFSQMRISYDERGNATERSFLDLNGNLSRHADGYTGWRSEFDLRGNETYRAYFGVDNEPILIKGIAGWRSEFDQYGNEIERKFFGLDGKPTRHQGGHSGWRTQYEGNRMVTKTYYGYEDNDGISQKRISYDEHGNATEISFLDLKGNLSRHTDGYAGWRSKFDSRGNETYRAYFDIDNEPTLVKGIAGWQSEFDQYGNQIETKFFGVDGKPTRHQGGHSGWRAQYEGDRMVTKTEYGYEGNDGFSQIRGSYDEHGNITEASFLDLNGNLSRHTNGHAGWRSKFDSRGNETYHAYFGVDNALTLVDGIAGWQSDFDPYGNQTERRFFGIDGKPTRHQDGHSGWRSEFDEHGNEVVRRFFGVDREPIIIKGISGWRSEFDARGNETYRTYVDANEKPTNHPDGYVAWRSEYDEHNQVRRREYLNSESRPMGIEIEIVKVFPGTQAASIGLKQKDIVLEYNGVKGGIAELMYEQKRVQGLPALTDIPMRIIRDGKELTFKLRPGPIGIQWTDRIVKPGS